MMRSLSLVRISTQGVSPPIPSLSESVIEYEPLTPQNLLAESQID